MGTDVDTVSQSADDEHVGTHLPQLMTEASDEVLAVSGGMARTDDVDDTSTVEVGITQIVQHQRSVVTLS